MKEQKSVNKNKVYSLHSSSRDDYNDMINFYSCEYTNREDIIKWGKQNNMPGYIYNLCMKNPIFFRIIHTLVDLTMAGGIELSPEFDNYIKTKMAVKIKNGYGRTDFEKERYKLAVNMNGEDVHDIVKQQLLNYYLYGTSSLDIFTSKGFGNISEIYYRNVNTCRILASKKNIRISNKGWGKSGYARGTYDVPLFDPINTDKGNMYVYMHINNNELCPYPDPYYLPALQVIDTDNDITTYHKSLIKNNFSTTTVITVPAGTSDEEMQKMADNLKDQKSGVLNAGSILLVRDDGSGNTVRIEAAPQDNFDSKYTNLESNVERKIFIGFNMHPPLVAGYNNGIGFNSQEFLEMYKIQMDSVCIPVQKYFEREWEYITGFGSAIKFKQSQRYKDAYGINNMDYTQTNNNDMSELKNIPTELLSDLSVNERRELIGYEEINDADADESILADRIGVGGTTAMIEIISNKDVLKETKAGLLSTLFGLNDEQINKILP